MTRFIEGRDRRQCLLLPDCVDDYVGDNSLVRVVDAFIDALDLPPLGFRDSAATGRPGYHPATLLKLYLYGYLNQVQSSRKLGFCQISRPTSSVSSGPSSPDSSGRQ
jgi:transposase